MYSKTGTYYVGDKPFEFVDSLWHLKHSVTSKLVDSSDVVEALFTRQKMRQRQQSRGKDESEAVRSRQIEERQLINIYAKRPKPNSQQINPIPTNRLKSK